MAKSVIPRNKFSNFLRNNEIKVISLNDILKEKEGSDGLEATLSFQNFICNLHRVTGSFPSIPFHSSTTSSPPRLSH